MATPNHTKGYPLQGWALGANDRRDAGRWPLHPHQSVPGDTAHRHTEQCPPL